MDDDGVLCFNGWLGECDASRVHLLERKTGVIAQNWSRYRTGERNVGVSTLKRVEQKVVGSSHIYNVGPDGAPLWTALWSDDELELWQVSKTTCRTIQFHHAWVSNEEFFCDYTRVESTKIYFTALSDYYEDMVRSGKGLIGIEDLAALIAAFRLGQFRREAALYQEKLGRCLELSLTEGSLALIILKDYGILNYISHYINKLIPHSEKITREVPLINRENAFNSYWLNTEENFSR